MSKAKEYDLVGELRDSFPELEDAYQERVRISGEEPPNSYEIVGALLRPRFKRELATGLVTDFVRRSAVFFEKVCASGDVEALNVIWVKIFEWLIGEPEKLKIVWPLLGKQTRAAIEDAAKRWRCSSNLP